MTYVLVNVPSFTECTPTNITWTGGVAPYSVFINVRDSSENLRQFVGINTSHFVWSPDVPAETLVSLQVIDTRNVLTVIEDPILVEQKPLGASCISSTLSSSVPGNTHSPSPLTPTGTPRNNPVSGSVIAAIVLGAVIFLSLLVALRWWYSRVRARRRQTENGNDTEKKVAVHGGNTSGLGESRSGVGSTSGRSIGNMDYSTIYTVHPFENPESIFYKEISTASPASDPDAMTPTRSAFIGSESLPSSSHPTNTAVHTETLSSTAGAVPQTRLGAPSVSPQSVPYMPALSDSDTDTARFSISTSSTRPPSYHTRRSTGSTLYTSLPGYQYPPSDPPPVYTYTSQPPGAPPSAFRAPTRRRRVPAPMPRKRRLDSQPDATGA